MNEQARKAILVVSFGTSYEDTRRLTIEAIEQTIARANPELPVYRAWTSRMILSRLRKESGLKINTITEAMEQMLTDGIREVTVQPTHMINGIENERMTEEIRRFSRSFHRILFGTPLLTSTRDCQELVRIIIEEFSSLPQDEALVLMGHGTPHYANHVYAALNYMFREAGHSNILLGTVEAYPDLDTLLPQLRAMKPEKIHLAPFMIVAGDHARNDMSGDSPQSWASRLIQAGFCVDCTLKGLGEYPAVRELFLKHAQEAGLNH